MNYKSGDRVRIKKGATLRSTSPSKGLPWKAGKSYEVTSVHEVEAQTTSE